MNFLGMASARFSVRKYQERPVEDEKINAILEAGRLAPTAHNYQPQKIYVVRSVEAREKLKSVCKCTFDAPVIFVVGYDRDRCWKNHLMPGYESGETDASIVCTHMMLEASDLGLGCCWVGLFSSEEIKSALRLPENVRVTSLLPTGYAAEGVEPIALHTTFRDMDDMVAWL